MSAQSSAEWDYLRSRQAAVLADYVHLSKTTLSSNDTTDPRASGRSSYLVTSAGEHRAVGVGNLGVCSVRTTDHARTSSVLMDRALLGLQLA